MFHPEFRVLIISNFCVFPVSHSYFLRTMRKTNSKIIEGIIIYFYCYPFRDVSTGILVYAVCHGCSVTIAMALSNVCIVYQYNTCVHECLSFQLLVHSLLGGSLPRCFWQYGLGPYRRPNITTFRREQIPSIGISLPPPKYVLPQAALSSNSPAATISDQIEPHSTMIGSE